MRKVALKKFPNRHKIIKALREKNNLIEVVDRFGRIVILNPIKHFLFERPYKNEEYQRELFRQMKMKGARESVK